MDVTKSSHSTWTTFSGGGHNRLGVTRETVRRGLRTSTHRYAEASEAAVIAPDYSDTSSFTANDANEIDRSVRTLSGTYHETWARSASNGELVKSSWTSETYNPTNTPPRLSVTKVPATGQETTPPQQSTSYYPDGRVYQTSGDLSPDMRYSYAVGAAGLETTRSYVDGTNLRESVTTESDLAGRTTGTEYADGADSHVYYNAKGQVNKTEDPDDVTTLYLYNAKGERTHTVLDLNANGEVDYDSDQITATKTYAVAAHGTTVIRTEHIVWRPQDTTEGGGTTIAWSDSAVNGLSSWTTNYPDGLDLVTSTVTSLGEEGDSTVTTTAADNSYTVRTTTAGLLTSVTSFDASGVTLASTSYTDETGASGYDAYNRPTHVTDSATGTVVTEYVDAVTDYVDNVTDAAGNTTSFDYDIRSRRTSVDAPDSLDAQDIILDNITTTAYFPDGAVKEVSGGQTYRRTYTYDYAARMKTLTTYGTHTAITAWNYDTDRGWLLNKRYGSNASGTSGTGPEYTYTDGGRLKSREWARTESNETSPVLTTYEYDDAGRLKKTLYSNTQQGTPNLYNVHDRMSRLRFNIQGELINGSAVRVHEYTYDSANLALDKETVVEGAYSSTATSTQYTSSQDFKRVLDRSHDSLLRPDGLSLMNGTTEEHDVSYAYMAGDSRLLSVTGHGQSHTYGYKYDSSAQARTGNVTGTSQGYMPYTVTSPAHTVVNTYEPNRNVLINKQNKATTGDVVRSNYLYDTNAVGQRLSLVTSGSAFTEAPAYAWSYNARGELVQANDSSTANNDRAYQYDGIGNREKTADGLLTALPATANYTPTKLNQYTKANGVTLPTSAYDVDGNYTNGPLPVDQTANATLLWNAENRLVSSTLSGTTTTYEYDYLGRRVAKVQGAAITRYVYDGWNLIAEYAGTTLGKTYTWGMDLSGSMQGAGGVGGLLAVTEHGSQSADHFYPTYDGNGNVSEYLDSAGAVQAHYEYDAFGNLTVEPDKTVTGFVEFAHKFSTKPQDQETGLYYYGYRYYDAVTGRWIKRDPIEEQGGNNLYGFVGNDGVSKIDIFGLQFYIAIVPAWWELSSERNFLIPGEGEESILSEITLDAGKEFASETSSQAEKFIKKIEGMSDSEFKEKTKNGVFVNWAKQLHNVKIAESNDWSGKHVEFEKIKYSVTRSGFIWWLKQEKKSQVELYVTGDATNILRRSSQRGGEELSQSYPWTVYALQAHGNESAEVNFPGFEERMHMSKVLPYVQSVGARSNLLISCFTNNQHVPEHHHFVPLEVEFNESECTLEFTPAQVLEGLSTTVKQ